HNQTMAVPPRVVHQRRATITALPLYYSGHLFKKQKGEKKFYGELRGSALFFYADIKQDTVKKYIYFLTYFSFVVTVIKVWNNIYYLYFKFKMTLCFPSLNKTLVALYFTGSLISWCVPPSCTGNVFLFFFLQKEIPSSLQLMPGQKLQLEDALYQEKKRTAALGPNPPLPPRPAFLSNSSPCFFSVSRQEAEQMLERNPEYGNIILRPSSKTNSYGLTMRILTNRLDITLTLLLSYFALLCQLTLHNFAMKLKLLLYYIYGQYSVRSHLENFSESNDKNNQTEKNGKQPKLFMNMA
uniref:SH2 domain-containing protein n=1 Tax=Periophthalmus magnuspinnatus TaxID=409849 RepID=A0A3B4A0R3_9GOBI